LKTELINYLHACCFSPTKQTFIKAIQKVNLVTFPGLSEKAVKQFLTPSVTTAKGHLDQERKNLQTSQIKEEDNHQDAFPESIDTTTHQVCASLMTFTTKETAYADLTGKFPNISARGNQYLLIAYDYDSNAILAEPLKNKTAGEIKRGWIELNNILHSRRVQPSTYILDNEASQDLKKLHCKIQNETSISPTPYTSTKC
jgi:hypothetical protein